MADKKIAFISKIRSLQVKISTGWKQFENGRLTANESEAKELRESRTFGIDFWEEVVAPNGVENSNRNEKRHNRNNGNDNNG